MSKVCQVTGKKAIVGNNVSHSKRRTKRKFMANLFTKRYFLPEENRWITLKVSAAGMRNINKNGLTSVLKEAKEKVISNHFVVSTIHKLFVNVRAGSIFSMKTDDLVLAALEVFKCAFHYWRFECL